jgi:hypothetical protein
MEALSGIVLVCGTLLGIVSMGLGLWFYVGVMDKWEGGTFIYNHQIGRQKLLN